MPNALATERSPYLLQHKDNPVDWLPWGEEALQRARDENKPIFLSVGYSTCHWCHVMEHESFENEAVAKQMNESFINIKVDREERPDIDLAYMAFVQVTTGSGGWPMSVWMTPDLQPFLGGTYFPPEDRGGRAGFPRLLNRVSELWTEDREKLETQGASVVEQLQAGLLPRSTESLPDLAEVAELAFKQFTDRYDHHQGGFGSAPKFPRPCTFDLLFRLRRHLPDDRNTRAQEMGVQTLIAMGRGGMHDHVGGGFHRYSVDDKWHVPHFEKMLYDQAQLAISYLEGYQLTGRQELAATARDIFRYVLRDLAHPDGGFYSAEDADSAQADSNEKKEGAFYVWTESELNEVLGADAPVFAALFGVKELGNAMSTSDPTGEFRGENILHRTRLIGEVSGEFAISPDDVGVLRDRCLARLFKQRAERTRPHLDDKILAAWNGLMISALAKGARVLGDAKLLDAAVRAAEFLQTNLMDNDGRLVRSWREGPSQIPGFASDYAFVIQAHLDLFEAGAGGQWLASAIALQKTFDQLYLDSSSGAYLSARAGEQDAILSITEDYDGAEPSPNSVAALNLLRLATILHSDGHRDRAKAILTALGAVLEKSPFTSPKLVAALDLCGAEPCQALIAGDANSLRGPLDTAFLPYLSLIPLDDQARALLTPHQAGLDQLQTDGEDAVVQLCRGTVCRAPAKTIDSVTALAEGLT